MFTGPLLSNGCHSIVACASVAGMSLPTRCLLMVINVAITNEVGYQFFLELIVIFHVFFWLCNPDHHFATSLLSYHDKHAEIKSESKPNGSI
jgi:hypothetical protein